MMRALKVMLLFLCLLQNRAHAQRFLANTCDSTILTKQDLERCRADAVYETQVLEITNYITFLKTAVLPKYRLMRRQVVIPETLRGAIKEIKASYDSTLHNRLDVFVSGMDSNQGYVQPKAYISSLLALEIFRFYPDVYAVMLNPVHFSLKPKPDVDSIHQIEKALNELYDAIPPVLRVKLLIESQGLVAERRAFSKSGSFELFQGNLPEKQRAQYNILNYLIWTN